MLVNTQPFFVLYTALLQQKYRYFAYICSITVGVIAIGIVVPLYFKNFTNILVEYTGENLYSELQNTALLITVWSLLYVLARYIANTSITRALPQAIKEITDGAFAKIHSLSYGYHSNNFVGAQVARIKRGADAMLDLEFQLTRGVYEAFIQLSASVIILYTISPTLAGIFTAFSGVIICITLVLLRYKMIVDKQVSEYDSKTSSMLADSVANALTVKAHAKEEFEIQNFQTITSKKAALQIRSWDWSRNIETAQGIIIILFQCAILLVAIHLYAQQKINIGSIVLLQTYFTLVTRYLVSIAENLKNIQRHMASSHELLELMNETTDVRDSALVTTIATLTPSITFKNVTFSYTKQTPVLHNFSVDIQPYQKVGIVGSSGNGKSTIFNLLLRFFDVDLGQIQIGTHNIQSISQRELRSFIGYLPQSPNLFHRSIAANIAYSKPSATDEEIIAAAKKAHAHEFIQKLPNGYNTLVGERGIKLSGGERQRVALARIILQDAPILLFDEATSALDSTSEKYIQQNMETIMAGKTAIVIAHRISTIQKMDRIIVVEGGSIIEDGTHAELLKINGKYAQLWQHQVDGFIAVE